MVGWHHQNGHELGQTPGDGEGEESLACCSSWGLKESNVTWRLNDNSIKHPYAAAVKSLQSCPTLCDPMDSSPPSSSGHTRNWSGLPSPSPRRPSE